MQTAYRPSRKRRSKKKRRMLLQRIFHNIHFYFPVRKERYPVRFLHGLDHGSHHLLPVVDKDLRAEPIQDHPQLQMPLLLLWWITAFLEPENFLSIFRIFSFGRKLNDV